MFAKYSVWVRHGSPWFATSSLQFAMVRHEFATILLQVRVRHARDQYNVAMYCFQLCIQSRFSYRLQTTAI
jgi:hypothetical protein